MATSLLSPNAKQKFDTLSGAPADGYKLWTYAAGTTTPQATYSNRAGTTPNANPIILNARGEATVYLTPGLVYDYKLTSGADVLEWTQAGVSAQAGEADAVNFLQAGADAIERTMQEKARESLSVKDFGAVGDAVTDDTVKVRAMFAAADAITADEDYVHGAMVQIPPGSYGISDTITLTRPPMVIGSGYAERSSGANGSGRGITQFVALSGLAGKPMFRIKSGTVGEVLHGGKFLNINLLGMDIASHGIWGSSLSHCDFDVRAFRFTTAGVLSDDGNAALSDRNIFDVHYVWGTHAACIGSHGLWFKGGNNGGVPGNPQNIVKRHTGLTKNGDGLRFEGDVDNTIVQHSASALDAGGTGRNIALIANADGTPRINFFQYVAGGLIQLDAATYGNRFHTSSESTTFTGGGKYDLLTADYDTGGFWQTRRHYLSDRIQFSTSDFSSVSGGAARALNGDTNGWGFDAAADEGIVAQRIIPITWRNGSITSVNLRFVMLGAQAGGAAVRWEVRLRSVSTDEVFTVSNLQAATTVLTSVAANTLNLATLTFATPEAITAGDLLVLQVFRMGTHAGDTATGDAMFYSAEVSFVSLGPQSAGSGVIQVPSMGT